METNQQKTIVENDVGDNIKRRILNLERENYAKKPEGLKDREMVERIKKIIEQEVGKCL